jgi:hypothetical protein
MSDDRWAKLGASGGIVFVLLLAASLIFGPGLDLPAIGDSPATVGAFVTSNHNEIQTAGALSFGAGFAFLFFLGSLVLALRSAEGAPGRLSAVAAAGGIAFVAIAAVGVIAHSTAALNAGVGGRVNAGDTTLNALWDVGAVAFTTMGFASAALLWATGLLTLRNGALPRPLGLLSLAGAAYIFVVSLFGTFTESGAFSPLNGLMGEIGLMVLLAWVGLTSLALVQSPVYKRRR